MKNIYEERAEILEEKIDKVLENAINCITKNIDEMYYRQFLSYHRYSTTSTFTINDVSSKEIAEYLVYVNKKDEELYLSFSEKPIISVNVLHDKIIFSLYNTCPTILFSENIDIKDSYIIEYDFLGAAVYEDKNQKLTFYSKNKKKSKGKDFLSVLLFQEFSVDKTFTEIISEIQKTDLKINRNGTFDFVDKSSDRLFLRSMVFYLNILSYEPFIENICKSVFLNFLKNNLYPEILYDLRCSNKVDFRKVTCFDNFIKIFNKDTQKYSLKNILDCPNFVLKEIGKDIYTKNLLNILNVFKSEKIKSQLTNNNIQIVCTFLNNYLFGNKYELDKKINSIILLVEDANYNIQKLAEYTLKHAMDNLFVDGIIYKLIHNFENYQDIVMVNKRNNLNLNIENVYKMYPKNILKVEEDISKFYTLVKDESLVIKFNKAYQDNKVRDRIYDEYIISSPTCPDDLIDEGKQMHHCVGGYIEKYIRGESSVYFLRKKDSPKTSYVTFDIVNSKLNQYVMAYDERVSDKDALKILKKWCSENKIKEHISTGRMI